MVTIYAVKIVNKRPRNLLNEIQNVSINGKQVKTDKITQIIPWFPRFTPQQLPATHSVATAHMREPLQGDNAYQVTNGGFRQRPIRWQPESGSSIYVRFNIVWSVVYSLRSYNINTPDYVETYSSDWLSTQTV